MLTSISSYLFPQLSILHVALLFILGTILSCSDDQNQNLSVSESPIGIEWKLISNFEPGNQLSATLSLINNGSDRLPANGWTLYFNSIRIPDLDSFPGDVSVSHINGYFFKMEPTDQFVGLEPGEQLDIPYRAQYFAIKASDAPEGFYFVYDNGSIEKVPAVSVRPFEEDEQVNRTPGDQTPVPTPEQTFAKNERLSHLENNALSPITPTPVTYLKNDGEFRFSDVVRMYADPAFGKEALNLGGSLMKEFGLDIEMTGSDEEGSDIYIRKAALESKSPEAYELDITSDGITVSAETSSGIFYGIQTLRSLLLNRVSEALVLDAASITDEPAFPYRGMHLDVARNFQSKESVLRLLDIMAFYKLNKFHFHLTDDEGWRLAIDALPELTEVGGRRGHTETEENFMIPMYGSGPDPSPGASMGSGWFSRKDYIDILKYAAERHIEVIPEIDVPGHARAAILAMEARARRFLAEGDSIAAEEFRLEEPEDKSSYRSVQNYTDNVINVCQESTYRFMNLVIDELNAMHEDANVPMQMMHIGGDEVPHGAWEKSPACKQTMEELDLKSARHLQGYFFSRISETLSKYNITMGGWEEVAFRETEDAQTIKPSFQDSVVPYVWSNIWGGGTEDRAYRLANSGYKVVMSHASNFYFDLAYNKHWQEPGFYWAAMMTTEEPFSFMPFNIFGMAATTNYGTRLPDDYFDDKVRLNPAAKENILGLQGQLWTETVNEPGRMEYMIFPRLLGLAERAWSGEPAWSSETDPSAREDIRVMAWNEFANRMAAIEIPKLDQIYPELNYRIPVPGAIIRDNMLHANISLPGFVLRYELDGSEPTAESPEYTGPVTIAFDHQPRIAAFNTSGRSGRSVQPVRRTNL
ncbi:family 20 glycosylhydrolase [Rhodohalobacter sp. 8-1]|uniref:family 20 glycosylhydrolase n=1 Tax=Rhodohalobacter sp. 8-1 TaxID=3131972 RepID=UPI0030EE1B50